MVIPVAIVWGCVVVLLLLRAALRHWRLQALPIAAPTPDAPSLAVIVPARNEGRNLRHCLRGLLSQSCPRLRIIVVNDGSTDATAAVAARMAAADSRLRLIELHDLPPGWTGKPHACAAGAAGASEDWLCFLDADSVVQPPLLHSALALAHERGLDLLALEPRRHVAGFWERLAVPAVSLLLAPRPRPGSVNNPNPAAAGGPFLLVRRSAYEAVGGHASFRGENADGPALARKLKAGGHKFAVLGARDLLRVCRRGGLGPVWESLSRHVSERAGLFGAFLLAPALLTVGWGMVLLPHWACHHLDPAWTELRPGPPYLDRSVIAGLAILAASVVLVIGHILRGRRFGVPYYYALLFPLGYTLGAVISLNALRLRLFQRVPWKGRVYGAPGKTVS